MPDAVSPENRDRPAPQTHASTPNLYWRLALPCALMVYCILGVLLILQNPGLQYDEALLVLGSVQMRISPHELTLPHDPDTWVCGLRRCFPLMTVRYVGAIKEYFGLPLFAIFGPSAAVLRLVSMFLGALGIWGIAKLIREQVNLPAAALTAGLVAINPAYLNMTVFDNGTVSIWMAGVGILCVAISRYTRVRTMAAAFWLGFAMGLGVWARANFLWLLAAIFLAALIVLGKRLRLPARHWMAGFAGAILGGLPFLVYQLVSKGGSWEAIGMFSFNEPLRQRLLNRLVMFSEALLSDREHRAMWDAPFLPDWQRWLFPMAVLVSCLVNLTGGPGRSKPRSILARLATLTLLLFAAILFLVRAPVSEHHLIALLPLAAVVSVLAASGMVARHRWASWVSVALATIYAGSALYWQFAAIQGLGRTGGVGPWSDAITELATRLEEAYPQREVKVLDWGLQNNLFILTDGRLHSREIFWGATQQQTGFHRPWIDEIREGGVFLMNGPRNRQMPVATQGFLEALVEANPFIRRFVVRQRNGARFAEVVDIEPNTLHRGAGNGYDAASIVSMENARFAEQLEGFHAIEQGGWRWTKREFAVTLDAPDQSAEGGALLTMQLLVTDTSIQKLGAITLTARLGDHILTPETFERSGPYTFRRDVPAGWMKSGRNRIDFSLDKALPPTPKDKREFGIVVVKISVESK